MGFLCLSLFCYALLCVHSSFAIILSLLVTNKLRGSRGGGGGGGGAGDPESPWWPIPTQKNCKRKYVSVEVPALSEIRRC